MNFLDQFSKSIIGAISGFDRIIFRGYLRSLSHDKGMASFLGVNNVLLKNFGGFVESLSNQLKKATLGFPEKYKRPIIYLPSSNVSKEEYAKKIMKQDRIEKGLICTFKTLEPCYSFGIKKDRDLKKLVLQVQQRKCLHVYHYLNHPQFGFMHVRIQTWLPFNIQVYINGREWLAQSMKKEGMSFVQRDNCFTKISNLQKAQRLLDKQVSQDWLSTLDKLSKIANPCLNDLLGDFRCEYDWSVFQSEWATDVMFKDRKSLDDLYPSILYHGMETLKSPDIMRFLGKTLTKQETIHGKFEGDVTTDIKTRPEGLRIKHRVKDNSIKVYNKQGSILRTETTINNPHEFKVSRPKEGDDQRKREILPMRKGISDISRRAAVSQACNDRYLESLATIDVQKTVGSILDQVTRPVYLNDTRVRALSPFQGIDFDLLNAFGSGDFLINGFQNKDIRQKIFGFAKNNEDKKKQSAKVSRLLRIMRAHGIIQKKQKSNRYELTPKGMVLIKAVIAVRNADVNKLVALAA